MKQAGSDLWPQGRVSVLRFVLGFAAAASLLTAMTTYAQTSSTQATAGQLGTMYGATAGATDGRLHVRPRPSRSALYSLQLTAPPNVSTTAYQQQYRDAFESAYQTAYDAAANPATALGQNTPTPSAQSTGK